MQTTTVIARDSATAMEMIAQRLGPDAILIATRHHPDGVEVTAGIEAPAAPAAAPLTSRFIEQAIGLGFERSLAAEFDGDAAEAWTRLTAALAERVAVMAPPHEGAAHIAIVGASGSGKTTALAQIAARLQREAPDGAVGFVCGDAGRIGGREQLRLIGQRLGVPVFEPELGQDVAELVAAVEPGRRLLIDMASDPLIAAGAAEALREEGGALSILCTLPLTAQLAQHRRMIAAFGSSADGFVVTHAGSGLPPGAAVSALVEARRPLAYLSRSADPFGGIETARASALPRLLVAALAGGDAGVQ
jgi:flagellar biosynthesis GTPase FlhF